MTQGVKSDEIWSNFERMLDDSDLKEEAFHQYMVKYPFLVPSWTPQDNIIYSKFRLGSQFTTDFAYCRFDTPGWHWHFIEIERPRKLIFTKNGNPTAPLAQAIRQVADWDAWFKANRSYVVNNFPHGDKISKYGLDEPELTLIIGRRHGVAEANRHLMRTFGGRIKIRTFDSLKDNIELPWARKKDKPLRCCSFTESGIIELSSVYVNS